VKTIRLSGLLLLACSALVACNDRSGINPDSGVAGNGGGGGLGGSGGTDGAVTPDVPAPVDMMVTPVDALDMAVDQGNPIDLGPEVPGGPVCGDSIVEMGEQCDDGNTRPGDGCSGVCETEPNFDCPQPGQACVSQVVCGDGKLTGGEPCDDGNTVNGDGCSSLCQVETGYACTTPGQPCTKVITAACGDGAVNAGEACDDGNTSSGDGCSSLCAREDGFTCAMPGKPCVRDDYCGDGRLSGAEQCDDGNTLPGDGCGNCRIEPFFTCPTPGMPCKTTIVCGDSKVVGDEACDDGNTTAGDGCSADCKQVEPGFSCPTTGGVGGKCTAIPKDFCGDGRLTFGEFCDDGNTTDGDGCSSQCRVEPGYSCASPGTKCTRVGFCGDGVLSVADGEQCDDHNSVGGDGCSSQCIIEANSVCPMPGQPCQSTVRCGDRKVNGGETCDDGNTADGDGCSHDCKTENGWTCITGGACRATKCGDGIKAGSEQCDDGNPTNKDGCSSTCLVELPGPTEGNGWVCPTPGQPCVRTMCGNGKQEGSEQCDDGNNDTGDHCSPFCRNEPICPPAGGACATACGDGLLLDVDIANGQQCDDGNTVDGDGCSHDCKIETGFKCTSMPLTQNPFQLPIVLRDFKGFPEGFNNNNVWVGNNAHPDFENINQGDTGIVQTTLGVNGKPVHAAGTSVSTINNKLGALPNGAGGVDYFAKWYKDDPLNKTVLQFLTFNTLAGGAGFQYDNEAFFPLDNNPAGWGNYLNTGHDFHFTSEVRYWFEYKGNEQLDFRGDDDVWVFVNKQLAVNIGGVHSFIDGSVILNANNGHGAVCDEVTNCGGNRRDVNLNLQPHSVYEIVVFQAERHTTESHYKLTLTNFTSTRSVCNTMCGDGIVAGSEVCDLGAANNIGAYGGCNMDCTLAPRCGDVVVQTNEQCDDGINLSSYGGSAKTCAPNCKFAPFCGDGNVDGAFGEACDQGADNGKGYGFCTTGCQLGPRCGDGAVTNDEECDDGMLNGTAQSACTALCKKKCGNGTLDNGEQCDDGTAKNVGGYGKCNPDCTQGPRCGDGIKNGTEQCDDGKNDGTYGTCAPMCVLGPRCGDGVVQTTAGEACDLGSMNLATPYGKDKCNLRCQKAPYCGDKQVDVAFGEKCDDGVNSGQPGSCATDCSAAIPLPMCGNGSIQAPEQCDDGVNNGTAGSMCDTNCKKKCGNGFRDPGEQCDDGKNDGSYGTCKPDCTLADYCGDGVKNGTEACDLGGANEANPYGTGKCSMLCTLAPYCGDGRIQASFGEKCDSTPGCSGVCQTVVVP
jgi:fibro-slime domain-containing protein